ncbi:MAG: azurin [Bacteroidota bacterium]
MIKRLFAGLFIASFALVSAGCGGGASTQEVVIEGNDQMKYNVGIINVKAGTEVTLTLNNVGSLPKESFGHNVVILQPGTDPVEFANAGMENVANDYIAPDMANLVVAKTEMLGGGETDTITFTAPAEPGQYPFVCTFPGHASMMQGVMVIT